MKNKTIIGLSGYAGSGKDLFCEILCELRPEFKRKSLADKLKVVKEKNPKPVVEEPKPELKDGN